MNTGKSTVIILKVAQSSNPGKDGYSIYCRLDNTYMYENFPLGSVRVQEWIEPVVDFTVCNLKPANVIDNMESLFVSCICNSHTYIHTYIRTHTHM